MSDRQKDEAEEKDHLPKNYWQFVTRLCLLGAGICLIFLVMPDSPPIMQEKAKRYLPQILWSWLLFSALPWSLAKLWQHRASLRGKWASWRASRGQSKQPVSGMVVSDHTNQVLVPEEEQASVSGERHLITRESPGSGQALTPPLTALPVNPNPNPRSAMTMGTAGESISTALQLAEFTVEEEVNVLKVEAGPVLQIVSFQLPPKVQLSKLAAKKEDIANHLGPQQGFDITAANDFKSAASFVIPHDQRDRAFVYMRDIAAELIAFAEKAILPMIFGKDVRGNPLLYDLVKMPHLLVCGATGSGKSVFVNTLLTSLLSVRSPAQLQLLLIDPKQVEFGVYKGLPHLLAPPVTDMKKAVHMIEKVIVEMERRYGLFAETGTRNLASYNAKHPEQPLPSIVIVIDEYADLMLVAGDMIEDAVQRITQMARAAGIHLILGTQRPSVNVVTGTIKSNLPSRVTFKLPSTKDYMTVLDRGAPKLLGFGDGVCTVQGGDLQRFQSAAISVADGEDTAFIEQLIDYWLQHDRGASKVTTKTWSQDKETETNSYRKSATSREELPSDSTKSSEPSQPWGLEQKDEDEVPWEVDQEERDVPMSNLEKEPHSSKGAAGDTDTYEQALEIVREEGGFKVSTIQGKLRVGFGEAASLAERMMEEGIVGPYDVESKWRPLIVQNNVRTEEELLDELRLYICQHRITRSVELREALGIQRETVLELMRDLVEEGFLLSPTSTKAGYKIAWSEDQLNTLLKQQEAHKDRRK
jgi:DNA segregation ATPase FtsK/SpoIIIE-like protein/biotin operon repressor